MQVSFDDFQKALVDGRITIHQFLEVMVDNFGQKRAMEIIKENLDIAMEKYEKNPRYIDSDPKYVDSNSSNFMYN